LATREARKINAIDLLVLMCLESQKGSPSYNDLAARFQTTSNSCPSRQAISKRINPECVLFFESVLARLIKTKFPKSELESLRKGLFNRILVQDSTVIKLPQRLFEIFRGVSNGSSSVCNARIQGIYDLVSGTFIFFSIDPYSKNDFAAATDLQLCKGDLSLRDRGYYTSSEMIRHISLGADLISRIRYKTTYFDLKTRLPLNLFKVLTRKGCVDMEVGLSADCKQKVRLVAMPVSDEIANQRRRKAKEESKGHNPSKELLDLMAWTIFITTIPKEKADFRKILSLYGLRWRIETIFKSWKSHMHFAKLHNVSENQLRVILTARFIMIVICMHNIYNPCYQRIYQKSKRQISMFKLLRYLMQNPEKVTEMLLINMDSDYPLSKTIDEALIKYCCYEKRKRLNFSQIETVAYA
jgi:hypothetical protein